MNRTRLKPGERVIARVNASLRVDRNQSDFFGFVRSGTPGILIAAIPYTSLTFSKQSDCFVLFYNGQLGWCGSAMLERVR